MLAKVSRRDVSYHKLFIIETEINTFKYIFNYVAIIILAEVKETSNFATIYTETQILYRKEVMQNRTCVANYALYLCNLCILTSNYLKCTCYPSSGLHRHVRQ